MKNMKETTKIIVAFILGTLVSGVVAYAGIVLSSDKVSYNNTTVESSLNNLFNDSLTGKNNIISALSNKGFNVTNNATYNEIVKSINELPIKLSKDEEGNYGYILGDSDKVNSFENNNIDVTDQLSIYVYKSYNSQIPFTEYKKQFKYAVISSLGEVLWTFSDSTTKLTTTKGGTVKIEIANYDYITCKSNVSGEWKTAYIYFTNN
jgi:hypothetical protein